MKRYSIADLSVDMDVSGRTQLQARPYLTEAVGPADIVLHCDPEKILAAKPEFNDLDTAEYLATGVIFARHLLKHQGLYVHASAVALDGKAYLFSANSGTGKSTHTEKWCRLFGATYLNDDKPALRLVDGKWMAYGTPWSGKNDLSSPMGVPLAGIAFLKRGDENRIFPMPPEQAVPQMMNQSLRRLDSDVMQIQLTLLDKLIRQIPIWELTCRNDDDAAIVAHNMMTRG